MAVPPWNTRVQVAAALSDAVRSYQSREAATHHRGPYGCDRSLSLLRARPVPLVPLDLVSALARLAAAHELSPASTTAQERAEREAGRTRPRGRLRELRA